MLVRYWERSKAAPTAAPIEIVVRDPDDLANHLQIPAQGTELVDCVDIGLRGGGEVRIHLSFIEGRQLAVDAANKVLSFIIAVPSPVPSYSSSTTLRFSFESKRDATWQMRGIDLAWFQASDRSPVSDGFSQWMTVGGNHDLTYQADGVPLNDLGVCGNGRWSKSGLWKGQCSLGFFIAESGESGHTLCLVIVPFGDNDGQRPNPNYSAFGDVALSQLNDTPMKGSGSVQLVPAAIFTPLGPPLMQAVPVYPDIAPKGWHAFLHWRLRAPGASVERHLAMSDVLRVWKTAVTRSIAGARLPHAGRPFLPLPLLDTQDQSVDPLLLFQLPAEKQSDLAQIHVYRTGTRADQNVTIFFPWQTGATVSSTQVAPAPADGLSMPPGWDATAQLRLKGSFAADLSRGWGDESGVGEYPLSPGTVGALLQLALRERADPEQLADWTIEKVELDAPSDWLTIGSLQVKPVSIQGVTGALHCGLRGTWNKQYCDIYPEIQLIDLPCLVRMSGAGDPSNEALQAMFDAEGRIEDELQRESSPLINYGGTEGIQAKLSVRVKCQPGRDSVIELRIQRGLDNPQGANAFYFQARPFSVAWLYPPQFDPQAGQDFAYWRSDDADGPQWRLPDATVEFDLPPQAVGEEMERGDRFWSVDANTNKKKAYIDASFPLRYRFSPPTHVVVRPSVQSRRYNKSPVNLSDILHGAKVQSFESEIVYPVRVSFETRGDGEPDVRIAESSAFFGKPAPNLPLPRVAQPGQPSLPPQVLADELQAWTESSAPARMQFVKEYRSLRQRHSGVRGSFVARLAQFHLYDPRRNDGELSLQQGLKFAIRDRESGGTPPIMSPLPTGSDLLPSQKTQIARFLKPPASGGQPPAWGDDSDGALRAGVLHTVEFPSELLAILTDGQYVSDKGSLERLYFSALGAGGKAAVSFDEGRTTFLVESQHGHVSRLLKIRIGRIALLWNKAKHIVVYERTVVPSQQFESEQPDPSTYGWPILRKTEEYVEPIEFVRDFESDATAQDNRTGFAKACEIVSRRIYVNGAWGADLGHGYEIPLWNAQDSSGFYPKPFLALLTHAAAGQVNRHWLDQPQHLYFYSNTDRGAGDDPDKWPALLALDCPAGLTRLPVLHVLYDPNQDVDATGLPGPRPGGARRPRFDLATVADGPANLQHGRGDTAMLASLESVSLARTIETDSAALHNGIQQDLTAIKEVAKYTARAEGVQARLRQLIEEMTATVAQCQPGDCSTLAAALRKRRDSAISEATARLDEVIGAQVPAQWWSQLTERLRVELRGRAIMPLAPMEAAARALADTSERLGNAADLLGDLANVRSQIAAGWTPVSQLLDRSGRTFSDEFVAPLRTASAKLDDQAQRLTQIIADVDALAAAPIDGFIAACGQIKAKIDSAKEVLKAAPQPALGTVFGRLLDALTQSQNALTEAQQAVRRTGISVGPYVVALKGLLKNVLEAARSADNSLRKSVDDLVAVSATSRQALEDHVAHIQALIDTAANWTSAEVSRTLGTLRQWLVVASKNLLVVYNGWIVIIDGAAAQAAQRVVDGYPGSPPIPGLRQLATTIVGALKTLAEQLRDGKYLDALVEDTETLIVALERDCTKVSQFLGAVNERLKTSEQEVKQRLSSIANSVLDDATRARVEAWGDTLKDYGDKTGKGLKLAKAIGELPQLPNLTFNSTRAEYVFDDLKRQIDTSPFAAKLREIDGGLKELGLVVPTQALLDQFVPNISSVDFSKIFRNLGGIDFNGLFSGFKLPKLDSNNIKVTHGVDPATRTAWVKAEVNAAFPQEQTLFGNDVMAVRVSRMALYAQTDISVVDGTRRSVTDGRFVGDWGLDFAGTRLVTFREVSARFDGGRFSFNIAPDKIDLHPAARFVSEIAKKIGDPLPPTVQLEKDERGFPVGARASLYLSVPNPPPLGPISIGPILLTAGLGLTLGRGGKLEIFGHASVGTQSAPIFIQYALLGGGFWLESKATYFDGKVEPSASLGLALGSVRALNVAGIARGSYSILLFASINITAAGGSFRAGFQLEGSARVLGIATVSVLLLLEAQHRSDGTGEGHGVLDVSIDICWCYTLHVRTEVTQKIG